MLDELMQAVNLRDLGGAHTADGRIVRRGLVYRSAALTDLDGERLEAVRALGIRFIVDLRRTAERQAFPTPWEVIGCTDYWSRDYEHTMADHASNRMRSTDFTVEEARERMIELYADLPFDHAESYARLFRAILDGEGPVLFHCAVGKDRTGVAAALILMVAGVPRDAILDDYMATGRFDLQGSPHVRSAPPMTEERTATFAPFFGVDPAYLDTMYEAIDARGGIDAYLRDTLGLDDTERATIRERLLEPVG